MESNENDIKVTTGESKLAQKSYEMISKTICNDHF